MTLGLLSGYWESKMVSMLDVFSGLLAESLRPPIPAKSYAGLASQFCLGSG